MRQQVQQIFSETLKSCIAKGLLPAEASGVEPQIDAPKQAAHGDWATNIAMVLQKRVGRKPREVAELLIQNLVDPEKKLTSVEIAGPGFINVRVAPSLWFDGLSDALAQGATFGRSQAGAGEKILVEFVSANPTGPLHVGHGRGAVVGDVLVRLLRNAGFDVATEYYINDAGGQVVVLGRSVHLRYLELCGRTVEFPKGSYPGEYVIDVARKLKAEYGERFIEAPESEWLDLFARAGMEHVLTGIRADLATFNITFDRWFSERTELHETHAIEKVLARLQERGLVYRGTLPAPVSEKANLDEDWEPKEQLLFAAKSFGDDEDRGLQKSDGTYTYFAGDIAYHENKLARGFQRLINIWGGDHTGAVKRLMAAVKALSGRDDALELLLVQLVNLYRDGQPVRMGKRSGNFVALRDILDEVGVDATRFFFVMRSASTTLDFDLALAKKQANENPVFYVQMGHARICSMLRKAAEAGHPTPDFDAAAVKRLTRADELDLIKRMLDWPDVVAGAARAREPHRIVFYMQETIAAFHSYYTRGKNEGFRVVSEDAELTRGRLLLCRGLQLVLRNGMAVLGVSAPEQMSMPEAEVEEV